MKKAYAVQDSDVRIVLDGVRALRIDTSAGARYEHSSDAHDSLFRTDASKFQKNFTWRTAVFDERMASLRWQSQRSRIPSTN